MRCEILHEKIQKWISLYQWNPFLYFFLYERAFVALKCESITVKQS